MMSVAVTTRSTRARWFIQSECSFTVTPPPPSLRAVSVAESAAMDYLADLGEAAGEDHQILRRPSEAARRENEGVQVPESDTSQTRRLSTLPFQAEGHRHCVESITNFGASFWRPTRGMGVRSDIAVTLSVTCRSVHAWFHSRYDTDP